MSIIIARHGETEWNEEGKLQGHHDSPLTKGGEETPKATGSVLNNEGWMPDSFVSSDLGRTRHTSRIIAEIINFDQSRIIFDPNIRELCFGVLEKTTKIEREKKYSEIQANREKYKWDFQIPGGESYADLHRRVLVRIDQVNHKINNLFVGHEGVNRILLMTHLGLSTEEALSIRQPNNVIYKVDGDSIQHRDVLEKGGEWQEGLLTR